MRSEVTLPTLLAICVGAGALWVGPLLMFAVLPIFELGKAPLGVIIVAVAETYVEFSVAMTNCGAVAAVVVLCSQGSGRTIWLRS